MVPDMQEKIKWLKRGTKNNILDPYDGNTSILFDISICRWLLGNVTSFRGYLQHTIVLPEEGRFARAE